MKLSNETLIATPQDMSESFVLKPIYLGNIVNLSIQLTFTGTPEGTLKLQCSNDLGNSNQVGKPMDSSVLTNWSDIGDSSQSITEAGDHTWSVQNCGYLWMRVVYVRSSGSGQVVQARYTVKGA